MTKTILLSCLLAFAAALAIAPDSHANEHSPEMEAAIELLALMDIDKMMSGMQDQVETMIQSQIQSMATCPAMTPAIEDYSREVSRLVGEQLTSESFLPEVAELYVEVFSLDELEGMVEFYRTPLGEKLLARMPELMQRSMEISERQMSELMPQIGVLADRFASEVSTAGAQCDKKSGSR